MKIVYDEEFFSSGTVTATANTGVVATPLLPAATGLKVSGKTAVSDFLTARPVLVPLYFTQLGADMTVDETATVVIDWYTDATGGYTHGATTFVAMTWTDADPAFEYWPGDVTAWDINYGGATEPPNAPLIPLPPFYKLTYTLAGAAKSMSFTIRMTYLIL